MPKRSSETAPLPQVLAVSAKALRDLEENLWQRIKVLQERDQLQHSSYDKLWDAHDLVEDVRIAVDSAVQTLPPGLATLAVSYAVVTFEGRPSRRQRFDNAVAALAAVRQAAEVQADRRSTAPADVAAINTALAVLDDVDDKIAAVRFPG
jgi:hypothetical protein